MDWYHRAEAMLLSAPKLNPDPVSSRSDIEAKDWTSYVPEGTVMFFEEKYQPEVFRAEPYDSIALAYDNDNRLRLCHEYYFRSLELHTSLNKQERVALVCSHHASGYQCRQQWLDLELVAQKMLLAAESAQSKKLILAARRLLAQSQINQNQMFKGLEHLGQVVILAHELKDKKLGTDEYNLKDSIQRMRPAILQKGQIEFLKSLVLAESFVNDPNLQHD